MYHQAQEIKPDYRLSALLFGVFCLVCGLLQAFNQITLFSLHIDSLLAGDYWRLLTGHLMHLNWQHYSMNMIGIGLGLIMFYRDISVKHWLISFVFIALLTSCGAIFIAEEQRHYVGFSAILHGWLLLGAIVIAPKEPKIAYAIAALMLIKVIVEANSASLTELIDVILKLINNEPQASMVKSEAPTATNIHIVGSLSGAIYGIIFFIIPSIKARQTTSHSPN